MFSLFMANELNLFTCRRPPGGSTDIPVHSDAAVSEGESQGLAHPEHPQQTEEGGGKVLPTGRPSSAQSELE